MTKIIKLYQEEEDKRRKLLLEQLLGKKSHKPKVFDILIQVEIVALLPFLHFSKIVKFSLIIGSDRMK